MSTHTSDGRRRQWLAVDVHYASSKLGIGLRERFGIVGLTVFDLFLRACKRSHIQGEITFNSEADFLNAIGVPGLHLYDERGAAWTLDEFFTYLGQQKNTRRTRSGGLTTVRSTRWEEWENRRSRPKDVGPMPARNESGMGTDKTRQDTENDSDIDIVSDVDDLPIGDWVWTEFARRRYSQQAGTIRHPTKWIAATERTAREEHWIRAQHLLRNFDITESQLVDILLSEESPRWLNDHRKERIS